ncbi:DUF262 domain-containing protein [Acinetobacter sp. ANC 3781]
MNYIETHDLKNSTIMKMFANRKRIKLDPPYQRAGGVWNIEKKQLLIDSLLNDFDIPKIYFHSYTRNQETNSEFSHSVIDGRQRLEAIWEFIEGRFSLASDFIYLRDPKINLSNLTYKDIASEYIDIRIDFDSVILPIIEVITDDIDLIEEMFSRLNDGEPLNAAEKRNAFTGAVTNSIRSLINHPFFTEKVKFQNIRYKHQDIAAKILFTESNLTNHKKLVDTKKIYLDKFVKDNIRNSTHIDGITQNVVKTLDNMSHVFMSKDELLRAQGNIVVYYLLFKNAESNNQLHLINRTKFIEWRKKLSDNKLLADISDSETDEQTNISYELLEFNRLSQQGTNDVSNIRERLRILSDYFEITLN